MTQPPAASMTWAWQSSLAGFAAALVFTWWATGRLVRWLAGRELGKAIRVDGPAHGAKAGTPTMGGLVMVGTIVASALALWLATGATEAAVVALGVVVFAGLGLMDDLAGLARRTGREPGVGLTARRMLAAQVFAATVLGLLWTGTNGESPGLAWSAFVLGLFVLAVVGTANGVNLSDGLDGLAAGTAAVAFAAFGLLPVAENAAGAAEALGPIRLAPLAASACGACLGFLVHNRHPARVFMGNVGSMALGAALAIIAVVSQRWWLLPIVAGVYVAEVVSDLVQIGYFRASRGKRLLRMAPLHHHFEAGGMPETVVVRRFWLAGLLCAAAGLLVAGR